MKNLVITITHVAQKKAKKKIESFQFPVMRGNPISPHEWHENESMFAEVINTTTIAKYSCHKIMVVSQARKMIFF
jgi:hypothetical protein